jgi:hypothetical protein
VVGAESLNLFQINGSFPENIANGKARTFDNQPGAQCKNNEVEADDQEEE